MKLFFKRIFLLLIAASAVPMVAEDDLWSTQELDDQTHEQSSNETSDHNASAQDVSDQNDTQKSSKKKKKKRKNTAAKVAGGAALLAAAGICAAKMWGGSSTGDEAKVVKRTQNTGATLGNLIQDCPTQIKDWTSADLDSLGAEEYQTYFIAMKPVECLAVANFLTSYIAEYPGNQAILRGFSNRLKKQANGQKPSTSKPQDTQQNQSNQVRRSESKDAQQQEALFEGQPLSEITQEVVNGWKANKCSGFKLAYLRKDTNSEVERIKALVDKRLLHPEILAELQQRSLQSSTSEPPRSGGGGLLRTLSPIPSSSSSVSPAVSRVSLDEKIDLASLPENIRNFLALGFDTVPGEVDVEQYKPGILEGYSLIVGVKPFYVWPSNGLMKNSGMSVLQALYPTRESIVDYSFRNDGYKFVPYLQDEKQGIWYQKGCNIFGFIHPGRLGEKRDLRGGYPLFLVAATAAAFEAKRAPERLQTNAQKFAPTGEYTNNGDTVRADLSSRKRSSSNNGKK